MDGNVSCRVSSHRIRGLTASGSPGHLIEACRPQFVKLVPNNIANTTAVASPAA